MELFESTIEAPLAERLRPQSLNDVVGQDHLLDEEGFIARCVASAKPASIILWGPPGCGKTTIARLYAKAFEAHFEQISAVFSGVADIKRVVAEAKSRSTSNMRTLLFVDEIHRFNKAQQDAFLPYVEDGTLILVGATTENPSFELNSALLSRAQVLTLQAHNADSLEKMLSRAEQETGELPVTDDARKTLLAFSGGDGRYLLNLVENILAVAGEGVLDVAGLEKIISRRSARYDKSGEMHYDLISAFQKSIRGSDVDGALYWLARMVDGGEDPLFIARRLIRMASEEIALADPQALVQAVAARDSYKALGSPEGELMLAQAVVYLALAPKSNAVYNAYNRALKEAKQTSELQPPLFARNAPTKLMKQLGYKEGYLYDHDQPDAFSGQNYFPEEMNRVNYYHPVSRGFERDMSKRLDYFNKLRKDRETDS